jgi:opacity protein-like surface antigen
MGEDEMQKLLVIVACFLMAACVSQAGFKAGPFVGYTMGGDVEDPGAAFGGQVVYAFNNYFSVELALYRFSDKPKYTESDGGYSYTTEVDMDVTPLTLMLRGSLPVADKLSVYGAVGGGYFMIDADSSTRHLPAGTSYDYDVDNGEGAIVAAGAEYEVVKNIELFAEFRYSFTRYPTSWTWVQNGRSYSGDDHERYDYGLVRVGANWKF